METSFSSWVVFAVPIMIMTVLCIPIKSMHYLEDTYADLEVLGSSCPPYDTCKRNSSRTISDNIYKCDCDSSCTLYNTCCVDSIFKSQTNSPGHKTNMKCLNIYNIPDYNIFMVDSCKNDEAYDSLCYSNPEEANDPFLMVPVRSKVSKIIYKNFFCAVCNEEVDSEHLELWNIEISVNGTILKNISELHFKFNKRFKSWTVYDGKDNKASYKTVVAVNIEPHTYGTYLKNCEAKLISNCARNWEGDERIAFKCRDYMAIVVNSQNVTYRNVHCALCNFEKLGNLECAKPKIRRLSRLPPPPPTRPFPTWPSPLWPTPPRSPFDINPGRDFPLIDVFNLKGRQRRCGRNMIYDKFACKCRCNSRIFKKELGRCVHKV